MLCTAMQRPEWCEAFLERVRAEGVTRALELAGSACSAYRRRHRDPEFRGQWDQAVTAHRLGQCATRLERERVSRGWKQQHLADLLGVSRQAVSLWEAGICIPEHNRLSAIAEAFGVADAEVEEWIYHWGEEAEEDVAAIRAARGGIVMQGEP